MLLEADVLVIDQVKYVLANDFQIRDIDGNPLGHIETLGSAKKRIFLGNREFIVYDGGEPSFKITDVRNLGRDRFEITTVDDRPLATLVKEWSFFKSRLSLILADGSNLTVSGSVLQRDYEIDGPGGPIATVSRTFPNMAAFFRGRDRYVLSIVDGTPPHRRQALIGAVIVIDRIRAKTER